MTVLTWKTRSGAAGARDSIPEICLSLPLRRRMSSLFPRPSHISVRLVLAVEGEGGGAELGDGWNGGLAMPPYPTTTTSTGGSGQRVANFFLQKWS